jgi:hypothetical protein
MAESCRDALESLEQAIAGALETVTAVGTSAEIERIVRLLMQKKLVTEMLLDKIDALAGYSSLSQPEPAKGEVASNQLCQWDQLMIPANNVTNSTLESAKNFQRFFL